MPGLVLISCCHGCYTNGSRTIRSAAHDRSRQTKFKKKGCPRSSRDGLGPQRSEDPLKEVTREASSLGRQPTRRSLSAAAPSGGRCIPPPRGW